MEQIQQAANLWATPFQEGTPVGSDVEVGDEQDEEKKATRERRAAERLSRNTMRAAMVLQTLSYQAVVHTLAAQQAHGSKSAVSNPEGDDGKSNNALSAHVLTTKDRLQVCKPYAEERVYHVLTTMNMDMTFRQFRDYKVTIISNSVRSVAFHSMKELTKNEYTTMPFKVLIMYAEGGLPYIVYDEDYSDKFLRASRYFKDVLKKGDQPCFKRFFTVMDAVHYLARFSSDRSHWKVRDTWIAPPALGDFIMRKHHKNWFVSVLPNNVMSKRIRKSRHLRFFNEVSFKKTFA